jgi:hypothetical protein
LLEHLETEKLDLFSGSALAGNAGAMEANSADTEMLESSDTSMHGTSVLQWSHFAERTDLEIGTDRMESATGEPGY